MLMPLSTVRDFITADIPDGILALRLSRLESLIRSYTNNNFVLPGWGQDCELQSGGLLSVNEGIYSENDTILITHSLRSDGLYTVTSVEDDALYKLSSDTQDDKGFANLVLYPPDVKMGAVMMLSYDLTRTDSEGIKTETVSRHSVEYLDSTDSNTILGYPVHLTSFLKPYRKARRY